MSILNSRAGRGLGRGWNFLPLLVILAWTIAGLAAIDTFINVVFAYPSDPKTAPTRLQAFFEYGRSTENALKRMTKPDRSLTAPITLSGWYEPLIATGSDGQENAASAPKLAKPIVTIYGGSHSVRLAEALGRVTNDLAWRSVGAPGATSNWSYGAFLRDRAGDHKGYRQSVAVVLTFNTNLLSAITSFSPTMWNYDSPMPYTADRFYLNNGKLQVMHPPYDSFDQYQRTLSNPNAWSQSVTYFAQHDPLFNPLSFRASVFDRSSLLRLARRAYNTDRHKKIEKAVLNRSSFYPESEAVKVARAIITEFAIRARADGKIPVIFLVNDLGYADVLYRALKPALDTGAIPYLSSHQFFSASDAQNYLPDSHFTDANDDLLAAALQDLVIKSYCKAGISVPAPRKIC